MIRITCHQCGREFIADKRLNKHGNPRRFCSRECWWLYETGERGTNFSGGRYVSEDPTIQITVLCPGHPRAGRWGHVPEHVLVAERALGRHLPSCHPVHHVDENRQNNSPGNLVICESEAYHALLHARADRLRDTGSLDLKRCERCHLIKPLASYNKDRTRWDGLNYLCQICARQRGRESYRRKQRANF